MHSAIVKTNPPLLIEDFCLFLAKICILSVFRLNLFMAIGSLYQISERDRDHKTITWKNKIGSTPPAEMMQACPSFEKSVRISSGGGGSKQKEGKKRRKKKGETGREMEGKREKEKKIVCVFEAKG